MVPHLVDEVLQRAADISSRSRLRSASTALLQVPRSKHGTIGYRAFHVATAKVWNILNTVDNVFTVFASVPKSAEDGDVPTIVLWYASLNATEWA